MLYFILIMGVILLIFSILVCATEDATLTIVAYSILGTLFIMIFISEKIDENIPQAIDVYRGNTTLKISYVDSVATDSVVVFKYK